MGAVLNPGTRLLWKTNVPDFATGVEAAGSLHFVRPVDHLRLIGAEVQLATCGNGLWEPYS